MSTIRTGVIGCCVCNLIIGDLEKGELTVIPFYFRGHSGRYDTGSGRYEPMAFCKEHLAAAEVLATVGDRMRL